MKQTELFCMIFALASFLSAALAGSEQPPADVAASARDFRKPGQPVVPVDDTTVLCEAEEFRVDRPGWTPRRWGSNYYAATLANTFMSRKAYLGAPAQSEPTAATIDVTVPKAGRYLALVRYEAAYRFETQFRLKIEQNGQVKLDRLYGARDNVKIWPWRQGLKKEVCWGWGAVENVVWEGHDAYVDLAAGAAKITLSAAAQPTPAARRNVDVVMLTSDEAQVKRRIAKENYLPLDGMLTQAGDVYLRVRALPGGAPVSLTVPNGREHSPYWVHLRTWKPRTLTSAAADWVEVGSLLDTLNDGQWTLTARPGAGGALNYQVEAGVRLADGRIKSIATFESKAPVLELAYDADTRYSARLRRQSDVLYDLLAYLKQHPVPGRAPRRTLIVCYTFDPRPADTKYTAALNEFIAMMGLTGLRKGAAIPNGYADVRSLSDAALTKKCEAWKAAGEAENMAVISMGDEIGLPRPPRNDHPGFRAYLKALGVKPADVDPNAGDDWNKITYSASPKAAAANPGLYYYAKRYDYHWGIQSLKTRTDILRRFLPNAGIGANYSPHHGAAYLGETHKWVTLFREGGMTMPWSEDYIWQVPVCSQQINFLGLDLFRAGIAGKPGAKIHYYVMPHWPGNTVDSWRRQFYGDLAHGMKIVNLFEFRPVQAAYTENHVSLPEMFLAVRRAFYELGDFEDIIQDGRVDPGVAGLWFGETGDIWNNARDPFAAGKRTLYCAIRHQQLTVDVAVEADAPADGLKSCKVLYLCEQNVSRAASKAIAAWVTAGGRVLATAGAGQLDELNRPNETLIALFGVRQQKLETPETSAVRYVKQDLPFAQAADTVTIQWDGRDAAFPVFGAVSRIKAEGADVRATFKDGSPAVTIKKTGRGAAVYCAFLPGLSYFKPAVPLRPVDRGSTDDAMAHIIPTEFDPAVRRLIGLPADGVARPVECSEPLVAAGIVRAKQGVLIPLVNWSAAPVKALTVTINAIVPTGKISLASGAPVRVARQNGVLTLTLDLDVADALVLR